MFSQGFFFPRRSLPKLQRQTSCIIPVLEAGLKYNINRSVQKIETSFTPSRHPSGKELGNQMCAAVLSSDEVAAE